MPRVDSKYLILGAMGGVIGIVLLDETVVGVALPTLREDLGLSQGTAHWVVNAYLLVFAALAATGGRLGDIFGHRTPFLLGLAVFAIASLACGLAESGGWLIAARAVQGIGAAAIFPLSIAMLSLVFPPEQRGMAVGIYGAIGSTFLALGPFIGGAFTEFLSWRWIFWINPVIAAGIAAVVLPTWRDLPRYKKTAHIDIGGLLCLVVGLSMIVFAVMEGPRWGWYHPTIVLGLVAGCLLLVAFFAVEQRSRDPLVQVSLFRAASFSACNLAVFAAQYSKIATIVFGALYLQDMLDMSPLVSGLVLLLAVVPVPLISVPSGQLFDRFGARPLVLGGLALTAAATLWLSLALKAESFAWLVPGLVVWGIGVTLLFAPPRTAVMEAVPPEKHGQAGGIVMTAQLLGGTIGMAICSAIYLMTQSFAAIFVANTVLLLAVLGFAWRAIEGTETKAAALG
jgi:EmrB/QacA subfamily drug resistance transporter